MDQAYPTTPFGRRTMTLASVASQAAARACPEGRAAHKWKVFRWTTEAREALGVSDRALSILNALLTFLPDTTMTAGPELIVFASNEQLSSRAHGMSESTLRRHVQALVVAGLVIRRDSPNGKRFARRGRAGEVEQAYGFDLTPLVSRTDELERLAEEAQRGRRDAALARERVTILRRDISKMLAVGIGSAVAGDWSSLQVEFSRLSFRLPRNPGHDMICRLANELLDLASRLGKLLETHVEAEIQTGNATQSDVHLQRSKPDTNILIEPPFGRGGGAVEESNPPRRPPSKLPLATILEACPDISFYSRHGISGWPDFLAAAETVRGALGVSPSAWDDARSAMGNVDAAITIATLLQRSEDIKSPGGYLRSLTEKSRAGRYSIGPVVMSLMQRQMRTKSAQGLRSTAPA